MRAWWSQIRSPAAIWIFLPALSGIFFVYFAHAYPTRHQWIAKVPQEIAALFLMGLATGLFLVRAWRFRLELDYILLLMAVNFLCREIHFTGTDTAVVIIAAAVLALTLYWIEPILASLEKAPLVRLAICGTFFTYLAALLIQRRVFTSNRIPLLPEEALLHVPLEEVTENIAHLYFIFIALAGFKQLSRRSE